MANVNALFERGRKRFLEGSIAILTDTIKAVLVNATSWTNSKAITAATNATPVVVTANSHGYANGDLIGIAGATGNTAINGRFKIANVTTNTFELTDYVTGANVAGNGTYAGSARTIWLSHDEFLSDIDAGARVATSGALSGVTSNHDNYGGIFDCNDFTFTAVSGSQCQALVFYKDTGSAATSPLIAIVTNATGLPVTPNGADINVTIDNGLFRVFML